MATIGKGVTVTVSGPLFSPNMVGIFRDALVDGLVALDDEFVEEVRKRYKRGKGLRTGRLAGSYEKARAVGQLTAQADSSAQRYTHRVEYGSRYMPGQHQRRNARKAIKTSLKNPMSQRSQKLLTRAVERLNG